MNLQGKTLAQGQIGGDVGELHQTLAQLGYPVPEAEQKAAQFGEGTQGAVRAFQADNGLTVTGEIDETGARALTNLIQKSTYVVSGQVTSPGRAAVGRLTVQIVDKNVGGDQPAVSGQTSDAGAYRLSAVIPPAVLAARHKTSPDLQARVSSRAADGTETLLAVSDVAYSAPKAVTLNVALPSTASGLPSQYETLTAAIAQLYPGRLSDLKETSEQQDVTYLAQKTGWDARAVAMAALAEQFSQTVTAPAASPSSPPAAPQTPSAPNPTTAGAVAAATVTPPATSSVVSLSPPFYFALLQSGAPANIDQLFRIPAARAAAIWTQAISQGVIPAALQADIPAATQAFQTLAANHMVSVQPQAGVSTLPVLLAPVLPGANQQRQFATLLSQFNGDWTAFWTSVAAAFGQATASQLQVVGQLHYLTLNNAPLVTALTKAVPDVTNSLAGLASGGFYDPAKWTPLISGTIPTGVPGTTPAEQTANYAAFLAAQVKLAFPTAVLADQISHGLIPIAAPVLVATEVSSFLSANQASFAIGAEPVAAFIARTKVAAPSAAAIVQIKRLQRTYALTTGDDNMKVLLNHNLDSAYAVTRYDAAGFTRAFGPQLGGADAAAQIHGRARQLFGTVTGLAVRYGLGLRAPTTGAPLNILDTGLQPQVSVSSSPPAATLGDLFGSLDYCTCSDCNSILSPAAYFVDLLNFLDQPSPTSGLANPQTELFSRRPDLEYLALSCDNTNTELPYIDIVNETLEAFVAGNLSLAGFQGFNTTPDVSSAELIAAPQNVNDQAYAALQTAFYPAPLPFNRPLELLRQHMTALGVALPDAMTTLRASDAIISTATPTSYGWSDILIERLGLSRDESRLFTDSTLQLGDLYGLPRASGQTEAQWNAATLAALQTLSLKDFSARTGVDYDDIISILKTQFINPGAALIERVEALGVSFAAIQALHSDPVGNAATFIASLPAGLDYSQYGGTDANAVVTWLTGPNYDVILGLITIANPNGGMDDCSGSALQFRYANPDPTANLLTATDFLKLIRFIRLWQKLQPLLQISDDDSAIQATDALLGALYPVADLPVGSSNAANDAANRPLLDAGFQTALWRAGFLVQVLNRLSLTSSALGPLLACWADIGTSGSQSLYASMFLTPTLLQQDPGAQAATVSAPVNTGDKLTTTINTIPVLYTVAAADTPQTAASNIAAAINATTTADPVSGMALNQRFRAQAKGTQVVITAGFSIQWTLSGPGGGTLSAAAVTDPTAQSATVGGTPATGEDFTVTIDTIPITYTASAGDTAATVAAGLAAAVNATTTPHPYSGLPLNNLLAVSAAGGVVTMRTADAGPPFDLACSIQIAGTGAYTAGAPVPAEVVVTLSGTVTTADVVTLVLNNVALTYTVTATDTTLEILAASLATTINGAAQPDQTYGSLPINQLLHAASGGATLTITPIDPSTSFTTAISSSGTEQFAVAGPTPASQTAAIAGTFPAGAVLTTTINGLNLFQTVAPGDTAAALATKIASAINAATVSDPATGLPLNTLVSASASGGTITVTAMNLTTPFTLAAAAEQGAYTAGQLSPPFADNGFGVFLGDPTQTLFGHQPLLCAACNLTGAEFALIAAALNFDATTPLTLANVSALFRYGWLAHALGISVLEFLALRRFSGLDPFASLDPSATPPAEPPVVRFIRLVQAMQKAGLAPIQALYLIWNQDLSGTLAPAFDAVAALALALRADFAAVESQFALQDDPDGTIAEQLMTTVYGAADTDFFFGLLNQTFTVSVDFSYASPTLPQPVLAVAAGRLIYDDAAKTLSASGLLTGSDETAIAAAAQVSTTDPTDNQIAGQVTLTPQSMANIAPGAVLLLDAGAAQETVVVASATTTSFTTTTTKAHNGSGTPFPIVNDPGLPAALSQLAAASQTAVAPFFAKHPELLALYTAYAASTAPLQTRRTTLLASFLPTLIDLRNVEQALAAITAQIGCDPSFAPALLQDAAILHADADPTSPGVADLTGIETGGLTAELFLGNDPTQPADQTVQAVGPVAYIQTATLAGAITTGVVITTTINGQAISYTATAADSSLDDLASHVAAAINTAGATAVTAAVSGTTIAISPSQPLTATSLFTLVCASSSPGLTYTAGQQLPGGSGSSGIAGRWRGYITPPQTGNYDFRVVADPGATVRLEVGGIDAQMAEASGVWSNQARIGLDIGALTSITLDVGSVKTTVALGWSSPPALGWTLIPATALFPAAPMARLGATYVRFLKTVSLASALSLTANEIAWLGTDVTQTVETQSAGQVAPSSAAIFTPASMSNIAVGAQLIIDSGPAQETVTVAATTATSFTTATHKNHDGFSAAFPIVSAPEPALNRGWLNSLPGTADADPVNAPVPDLATAAKLTSALAGVVDFARLKLALSPTDERLLTALQNPLASLANGQSALLGLTGWASVSAQALCARFFGDASLGHLGDVRNFARLSDAMALVQACRVTAPALLAAVTNAPTPTTVSGLQSALRAFYAASDWLNVIQPINDTLRRLQRDALVKWILQRLSAQPSNTATTADDLYAWFLIDPSTEPAVLTSRIRLGLSAVQLFIERILQGLELNVAPGDIDPQQWQWMKRYRVWQANREVFLWPENWLYPQLRDDQSPIFEQVMSSLLQSDITDDAATEAYLDYLSGLADVAKLEPCGLYYVPATADSNEITYVVARSFGTTGTYYFRQLQDAAWSPWTEVPIDCEDMPLTPIIWNGRLFLFWLKVVKDASAAMQTVTQQAQGVTTLDTTSAANLLSNSALESQKVTVQATLCWTEFYNGKWQPTKSSDPSRPTTIGSYDPSGAGAFDVFRNQTRLVPATCTGAFAPILGPGGGHGPVIILPPIPDDALILAISTPQQPFPRLTGGGGAGFLLHNTHSVPTPLEDVLASLGNIGAFLDVPAPYRQTDAPDDPLKTTLPPYAGGAGDGNLTISYFSAITEVESDTPEADPLVLQFHWLPRITETQPGLPGIWTAPFIYEDRRNLFYVTSTADQATFRGPTFGIGLTATAGGTGSVTLPKLQVETSDAAGITMTLQGLGTVTYQGTVIQKSGSAVAAAPAA